jgi:superfamily II DNA or RNA helicase
LGVSPKTSSTLELIRNFVEELFAAVRAACPTSTWSKAVDHVRRLAVTGVSEEDDEIVCRVKTLARAVPLNVQLYPVDAEWACDCGLTTKCCEHVAAAVIALKQARAKGQSLPQGISGGARLKYRFVRYRDFLSLSRVVVRTNGEEVPLTTTLASAVAVVSMGINVNPSQQDLNADRVLGHRISGPLHAELGVLIVRILAGSKDVEFDGGPVYISTEGLRPQATIKDHPSGGFDIEVARDPRIEEVVAPGVARGGTTLYLLEETELTGMRLEKLPSQRVYPASDAAMLVAQIVPEMERRCALTIHTKKLPKLVRGIPPRVVVEATQEGGTLSVFATLVYGDPPVARIDGDRLVHLGGDIPQRDANAEQRVLESLKQELGLAPGNRVFLNADQATLMAIKLDAYAGEVRGNRSGFIRQTELAPHLREDADGLKLVFSAENDAGETLEADLDAVHAAWGNEQSLVPLLGGGWARLPAEWLTRYADRVAELVASRKPGARPPAHLKPLMLELCQALDYPPPADLEPLRALLEGRDTLPKTELPSDLTATLRPYQIEGVSWLTLMREAGLGATLADDMGLGKTLQTLCILRGRCLVVSPTSVVFNWALELAKFRPGLKVNVFQGKNRQLDPDAEVTLTSYALLRLNLAVFQSVGWDILVLDEAQTIKNPESQVAQAAFQVNAKFRLTLSGTPVENRLEELWSQFHFTNPGLLGGRSEFRELYSDPIRLGQAGAAARLRRRIAPFLLRRDKRTVAPELPPRTDSVLYCDLGPEERELYNTVYASTQREVVELLKKGGGVMQALEALLRLRQAACHMSLLPGQQAPSSAKFERLLTALEHAHADGHKVLVFSQWTRLLDLLEPHLVQAGIRFCRLDGTTRDREAVVSKFQNPDGPETMLLSLKAGGTGLNLTAADHVFLLDLWWNPAVEQQAADRAHRIGQDRPVFVNRLVARDTVEERILKLQEHKRGLADAALGEADQAAGLSREDLLELLS